MKALVESFDAVMPGALRLPAPTAASIRHINAHFGLTLPDSLLDFVRASRSAGHWFAGLGPDYDAGTHIIRINAYWRERADGQAIPRHLVIINLGYDDDCDCLDVGSFDAATGEYAIRYWSPGVAGGARYATFESYVEHQISGWKKSRR